MKSELELLKQANAILRSVNSIVERKGETTNWEGISKVVKLALAEQHELLLAKNCYISDVSGSTFLVCNDCGKSDNTVRHRESGYGIQCYE